MEFHFILPGRDPVEYRTHKIHADEVRIVPGQPSPLTSTIGPDTIELLQGGNVIASFSAADITTWWTEGLPG